MLEPQERRLLLDALRPPPGYELDHAIGTTYSLDLIALLSAPLAFSTFAESDSADSDPLVLLEALRASAERITLFCDAGRIYVPPVDRVLLANLESSVVECVAPRGGAFHPKIWLLRFANEEEALVRFLCLSRNLTFDRCWDTALVLDGRVRGRNRAANRPLAEFLGALPEMAARQLAAGRLEAIERLATDALKVEWELPAPFGEVAFHPLGHRKTRSPWPFENARVDRMLVISPFISEQTLKRLSQEGDGHLLVSRADQLDRCDPAAIKSRFLEALVFGEGAVEDDSGEEERGAIRGLHAKLYAADQGWGATVWTGSANATESAFERNVEFLVELTGPKGQVGVDAILGTGDAVRLRSLLVAYERPDQQLSESEDERRLEREADLLRRRLAEASLELRVLPGAEPGSWDMVLRSLAPIEPPENLASFECWPISRGREVGGQPVELGAAGALARFTGLPLELLTPFIACRGVLRSGGTEITRDFVLNLVLLDEPQERRAHLLRSMLSSRGEVLRYLLYLLSGDSVEAVRALTGRENRVGGSDGSGTGLETPLLESLLRTLDREPGKLQAVERVIGELEQDTGGASLLPAGWDSVWGPVSAVARRRRR